MFQTIAREAMPRSILFAYGYVIHYLILRSYARLSYPPGIDRHFIDHPLINIAFPVLGGFFVSWLLIAVACPASSSGWSKRTALMDGLIGIVATVLTFEAFFVLASLFLVNQSPQDSFHATLLWIQTSGRVPMAYSVPVGFACGVFLAALGVFVRERFTRRLPSVSPEIKRHEPLDRAPTPQGLQMLGAFLRAALVGGVAFWLPAVILEAAHSAAVPLLILVNLAMVLGWLALVKILSRKSNWGGRRVALFSLVGIYFAGPILLLLGGRFITGQVQAIPEWQFFSTLLLGPLLTGIHVETLAALWIVTLYGVSGFVSRRREESLEGGGA